MNNKQNAETGDDLRARLKQSSIFQMIEKQQIESRQFEIHPEADSLRKIPWEGMLTIRFETDSYASDNDVAEFRRDDFVRVFMDNLIRYHWTLRHKQVYWVAATEFGKSGQAHCHILFSFLPLTRLGRDHPNLGFIDCMANDSLEHVCELVGCPIHSVDIQWEIKFDDFGLVGYFAKKEPGREDHKHFIWNSDRESSLEKLLEELREHSEKGNQ
jgi:hypothetical protein